MKPETVLPPLAETKQRVERAVAESQVGHEQMVALLAFLNARLISRYRAEPIVRDEVELYRKILGLLDRPIISTPTLTRPTIITPPPSAEPTSSPKRGVLRPVLRGIVVRTPGDKPADVKRPK